MPNIIMRDTKAEEVKDLIVKTRADRHIVMVMPDGETWSDLDGSMIFELSDVAYQELQHCEDFNGLYDRDIPIEHRHIAAMLDCWEEKD